MHSLKPPYSSLVLLVVSSTFPSALDPRAGVPNVGFRLYFPEMIPEPAVSSFSSESPTKCVVPTKLLVLLPYQTPSGSFFICFTVD